MRSVKCVKQRMPVVAGAGVGGMRRPPVAADVRHVSAAAAASTTQPPWTHGTSTYSHTHMRAHCLNYDFPGEHGVSWFSPSIFSIYSGTLHLI